MSDKEILEKAIQKAIDSGWKLLDMPNIVGFKIKQPIPPKGYPWFLFRSFNDKGVEVEVNIEHIIFDKSFARCLWGDELQSVCIGCGKIREWRYDTSCCNNASSSDYDWSEPWERNLQEMVIAPDPIKYLGEHLND